MTVSKKSWRPPLSQRKFVDRETLTAEVTIAPLATSAQTAVPPQFVIFSKATVVRLSNPAELENECRCGAREVDCGDTAGSVPRQG